MTLRICEHDDLDEVVRIETQSFPDPFDRFVFARYLLLAREGFIVACDVREEIVGYVIAEAQGNKGLIVSIAVAAGQRRRGTGEKLMRAAIEHLAAKGAGLVYLQVGKSNKGAIEFYRRLSFRTTGTVLERYYANGEDALVMVRPL